MLLECHNCGAPLDVPDRATKVRCGYCRQMSDVGAFRRVADAPPPDWTPPVHWTPAEGSNLPRVPLEFHPVRFVTNMVMRVLALSLIAALLVGGFIVWRVTSAVADMSGNPAAQLDKAMAQVANAVASASHAASRAAGALEQPIVCQNNDTVKVVGRTLSVTGGTVAMANDNCELRLVACTLTGETAVSAEGNSHVIIEGGTLTATGPAITLGGNSIVEVSGTNIHGEPGVRASDNAQARVRTSVVAGRHVAVFTKNNAKVDTEGSTVEGQVVGGRRRLPH